MNKPHFIIIGAQKCGTTWLWNRIGQHPETSLKKRNRDKEIYYFSNAKLYRKGPEWYYRHFQDLDGRKLIGEASTHYFYDRPTFSDGTPDETLPVIPELIKRELPDVKILLILRDPVRRYISAYFHHLQYRFYSPRMGLLQAAKEAPAAKLMERSYYARYLSLWQKYFPSEQMRCLIFEEDIALHPEKTLAQIYSFLGLDPGFKPKNLRQGENSGWTWSHLVLGYYGGPLYRYLYSALGKAGLKPLLARVNFVKPPEFSREEILTLRELFLPEKKELESLLGRNLDMWKYDLS